jgi:surfeit locus 1 family protein
MTRLPHGDAGEYARPGTAAASASRRGILIWGGLLVIVLVAAFISLGLWQWRKYEAKTNLQAELDARSRSAVVAMSAAPVDAESLRYRHVSLRGEFETGRQILVDNRVHHERAGYHVVTPLRLAGSEIRVLVNRGWIPAGSSRSFVPVVASPPGEVELTGIAVVPGTRFFTLAPAPAGWQPVWQNLDLGAFAAAAPWPVQPVVVQLDADAPHGFAREWPRPDERAEVHRSYALQWFGFALSSIAIWLWFVLRKS